MWLLPRTVIQSVLLVGLCTSSVMACSEAAKETAGEGEGEGEGEAEGGLALVLGMLRRVSWLFFA